MYISKNDIDYKELPSKKIPKEKEYNFTISRQSACQIFIEKPKQPQPPKPVCV
jgi:hypothetical protein